MDTIILLLTGGGPGKKTAHMPKERSYKWKLGLSWFIMHKWLQEFAYQTPISWVVFLVTFIATMAITMATVSFHAIRAGLANPVKSLKTE